MFTVLQSFNNDILDMYNFIYMCVLLIAEDTTPSEKNKELEINLFSPFLQLLNGQQNIKLGK